MKGCTGKKTNTVNMHYVEESHWKVNFEYQITGGMRYVSFVVWLDRCSQEVSMRA